MVSIPRPFRTRTAFVVFALALLPAVPAYAEPAPTTPATTAEARTGQILAGPGGFLAAGSYYTPLSVVQRGESATFHNYDIALHDVASVATHPDGRRLFSSPLIGLSQSADVAGVGDLEDGIYDFYCTLHPWMKGRLGVVEIPGSGTDPEAGADGGWRMYGADLGNGRDNADGPAPSAVNSLGRAWQYVSGNEGDFSGTPVVGEGKVFAGSSLGRVVALDEQTGGVVWKVNLNTPTETAIITASAAYDGGVVYVPVSARTNGSHKPYVIALRASDGLELWRTYVDTEQTLGDLYGSPVIWETRVNDEPWKTLYIGTSSWDSGGSGQRELHLGTVVALDLLDAGKLRWRTYMYRDGDKPAPRTRADVPKTADRITYNGAAVWSTPALDPTVATLYVGTGNGYTTRHALTDSLVALDALTGDMKRHYQATRHDSWTLARPTQGTDADFGASPQLLTGPNGERWLGAGQKNMHVVDETTGRAEPNTMAGLTRYHVVDRDTMQLVWKTAVGPGYWWGGITGSTAYDGRRIYGGTVYGQQWSLDAATGELIWMTSSQDSVVHMGPTTVARGVVYSTTGVGGIAAWDADTGAPLWTARIGNGPSAGGIAVTNDTVYAAQGLTTSTGTITAFRAPS